MEKITAVVVDDEMQSIKFIVQLLQMYCPAVHVVAAAQNINDAEIIINKFQPQLVFLDIEMPFGSGFQLLKRLPEIHFQIVFITAFNQYALQAIKCSAIDYILKPINPAELVTAIQKTTQRLHGNYINQQVETLLDNAQRDDICKRKICLHTFNSIIFVSIDTILHLQAKGNYTEVFLQHATSETVSKRLKDFEEILPADIFFRVHHSHIVNINYIARYNKGRGGIINMEDGSMIEVSQRRRDDFLLLLNK